MRIAKNLSTKEHEGFTKGAVILIVSALSSRFFVYVWLCGEILFLKGYRKQSGEG